MKNLKFIFILLMTFFVYVSTFAQGGHTKNVNSMGVNMSFIQDNTKLKEGELVSNVLRINNGTNKDLELSLQLSVPAGWKLFGLRTIQLSIKANDSVFVPVRVCPGFSLKGNTNYVVNAFLATESFTITNSIWYISVEKISSWHANPSANRIYFAAGADTASFSVNISNFGNADEILNVHVDLDKELSFINSAGEIINLSSRPVILSYGRDTILEYTVKRKEIIKIPTEDEPDPGKMPNSYIVKLKIINEKIGRGGNKSWSGSIELKKLPEELSIVKTGSGAVPMTIDFNTYDMLSGNTYASLNLTGIKRFKDNSFLTYFYQGSFIQNELNTKSFLGNYQNIGYFHRYFSLEAGDIGANKAGSTLSGKGIKGMLYLKNNKIGGLFVRRPELFNTVNQQGYGLFHNFDSKKINFESFYQHSDYIIKKITSDYGMMNVSFRLLKRHSFRLGFGYSNENHAWIANNVKQVSGYGFTAGYSTSYKNFNTSLSIQKGSPSYTPRRGIALYNALAVYRINPTYSLSAQLTISNNAPEFYVDGILQTTSIFNKQSNYLLKLAYNAKKYTLVFNPLYNTQSTNIISANSIGHNLEYRMKSVGKLRVSSTIYTAFVKFPQHTEIDPIFVVNSKFAIAWNQFQFNLRYQYGPYYMMEQLQYVVEPINPQKLYSTFYHDYWFFKNLFRLNTNFNYIYSTINEKHQFSTRPELFYYSKSGVVLSLYSRFLLYANGEQVRNINHPGAGSTTEIVPASSTGRFELGAGIKFNVNVPIVHSNNYDVKVVVFRDLNGNGVKDPNEKGIENMLVRFRINDTIESQNNLKDTYGETQVSEWELISNIYGNAYFNKVPMGNYVITAMPLASLGGWFDGKTFYKSVTKDQVLYIPLSKGARLSGGILIERDRLTDNKPIALGNIRVTARSVIENKSFSTLTAENGTFTLYVPNGEYEVFINEAAVGERWEFMQNNIPLKVEESYENYNVSFYLMEKKRTIKSNSKTDPSKNSAQKPITINDLRVSQYGNTQTTSGREPNYISVSEIQEEGKQWVIQLFPNEGPRLYLTDFDTLKGVIIVRCLQGTNNGFIYLSESFDKKKEAKERLEKVIEKGFKDAKVVHFTFEKLNSSSGIKVEKSLKLLQTDEDKAMYRVEFKSSPTKMTIELLEKIVPQENEIFEIALDGMWKYSVGNFVSIEDANDYLKKLSQKYNLKDLKVVQYLEVK